jgi:YesN/AraC family two-component response regulator
VVIVEDEPLVAVSIAKKLQRMGLDVVGTYESGRDAVSIIIDQVPDL